MEDGDDAHAVALVELDEQLHDIDLVAQIEVDGRLVEDQHPRRLGKRHGQDDQLALAEGQPSSIAAGQLADPDPIDGRH